jgi:hypothetical protein
VLIPVLSGNFIVNAAESADKKSLAVVTGVKAPQVAQPKAALKPLVINADVLRYAGRGPVVVHASPLRYVGQGPLVITSATLRYSGSGPVVIHANTLKYSGTTR